MGITKMAAVRGLIPCGNKLSEVKNNLYRLMTTTAMVLEERLGPEGLDIVAEIFRRLGNEDAMTMKKRLGLGESLQDALDAWLVVGNVMGAKIKVDKISSNRVETEHPFCPQHESFVSQGRLYCDAVCIPYVSSLAEGIASGVTTEVVHPADFEHTCTKALVARNDE